MLNYQRVPSFLGDIYCCASPLLLLSRSALSTRLPFCQKRGALLEKNQTRAEPKICRNPSMKYIKNIWSIYVKPPKRDKNLENILFSSAFVIVLSIQNMSRFNRSLCNISSCFPKFQWLKTSVSPQIGIRSGIPGIALFSDQHFNLQDLTCNRSMEICSSTCHQSHTGCSLWFIQWSQGSSAVYCYQLFLLPSLGFSWYC